MDSGRAQGVRGVKIAIVAISRKGRLIAQSLRRGFSEEETSCFYPAPGRLRELMGEIFDKQKFEGLIFIMALGIAVRMLAGYLKDKYRDPAVVVVDESAHFAISALSGHEGGANNLSIQVANILDAQPVITTASEALKDIIVGIGCRKGVAREEVLSAIKQALKRVKLTLKRVKYIATVDLKAKERGLLKASQHLEIPLRIISRARIINYKGSYTKSEFVRKKIGIEGVSEPCALLAGIRTRLILPKTKLNGVTIAIAKESYPLSASARVTATF